MARQIENEPRTETGYAAAGGFDPPDFGAVHRHKPIKAIVGVTILVLLSSVFYEFGHRPAVHSAAPPHQNFALSNR